MYDWLKKIRIDKGYRSCKEVASLIRISQSHYTSIENGSRKPSVRTAKSIAKLLGFDWTKFY
ncbi:MAG: helix-turn-helix transcriptional regulator [Eubacteriales bacterium]|nr:helix-turn-helix transcriptional regulator [Eubacteriales bacterium]